MPKGVVSRIEIAWVHPHGRGDEGDVVHDRREEADRQSDEGVALEFLVEEEGDIGEGSGSLEDGNCEQDPEKKEDGGEVDSA